MNKPPGMWAAVFVVFSSFIAFAQPSLQFPNLPASPVGPQLVAWSDLQKPQPIPQPLPPPERADQSPAERTPSDPSQAQPAQPPSQAQPSAQTFVGTIVKEGDKYVLKVSESVAYQIDDQEKAKIYEGKKVRVSGSLDARNRLLHVTSIETLV